LGEFLVEAWDNASLTTNPGFLPGREFTKSTYQGSKGELEPTGSPTSFTISPAIIDVFTGKIHRLCADKILFDTVERKWKRIPDVPGMNRSGWSRKPIVQSMLRPLSRMVGNAYFQFY